MKFKPENAGELRKAREFFLDPNTIPERTAFCRDYRQFTYLVHEAPSTSFVDSGAAQKIGRYWYYWPAAAAAWGVDQAARAHGGVK